MLAWLSRWLKPINSIDELVSRKKTISSCLWWVECNIEYEEIGTTFPQLEEIFKRKRGNCKSFSVITAEILRRFGFFPYLVCYSWEGKNGKDLHHSIVIYQAGAVWHYVSLGVSHRIIPTPASLVEAVKNICPDAFYAQEVSDNGSHLQTLIAWKS